MNRSRARPLADLLFVFAAPLVWLLHLALLYGAEAVICTPPLGSEAMMMWLGAVATAAALAALAMLAAISMRRVAGPPDERSAAAFLHKAMLPLALLSAVGVIWTAVPLALVPVCVS